MILYLASDASPSFGQNGESEHAEIRIVFPSLINIGMAGDKRSFRLLLRGFRSEAAANPKPVY